jgi:hypothetical protein
MIDLSDHDIRHAAQLISFESLDAATAAAIEAIDLSQNLLAALPSRLLRPLSGLTELDLSGNDFHAFPVALCQLPSLTRLDLSHNALTAVDASAELFARGLPRLATLLLRSNRLEALPLGLCGCGELRSLDLTANRLGMGLCADGALAGTARLASLALGYNGLLALPASLWALPLTALDLSANRLGALPAEVGRLAPTLESLALDDLPLRALPPALGACARLRTLALSRERLEWPPADVMRRPLAAVLAWLRAHEAGPPPAAPQLAPEAPASPEAEEEAAVQEREQRAEQAALRLCADERRSACAEHMARVRAALEAAAAADARLSDAQRKLSERRQSAAAEAEAAQLSVASAAARVAAIPKRHLDELRQLPTPPEAVRLTLQAVHALIEASECHGANSDARGLRQVAMRAAGAGMMAGSLTGGSARGASTLLAAPWEAVRGTLQKGFQARVERFDAARVSPAVCGAVRAALPSGADTAGAVGKASVACGPLYRWACATLDLADGLHAARPFEAEIAALEAEQAALAKRRRDAQERVRELRTELAQLTVEEEALRRELAEGSGD